MFHKLFIYNDLLASVQRELDWLAYELILVLLKEGLKILI